MTVKAIVEYNPIYQSGAAANRLLGLVKGLTTAGVNIEFYVVDGYLSKSEKEAMGITGERNGLKFTYIVHSLDDTIWKKRFSKYVRSYYLRYVIKRRLKHHLGKEKSIYWLSTNLNQWEIFYELKKENKLTLFVELNEFLDIHRSNSTS